MSNTLDYQTRISQLEAELTHERSARQRAEAACAAIRKLINDELETTRSECASIKENPHTYCDSDVIGFPYQLAELELIAQTANSLNCGADYVPRAQVEAEQAKVAVMEASAKAIKDVLAQIKQNTVFHGRIVRAGCMDFSHKDTEGLIVAMPSSELAAFKENLLYRDVVVTALPREETR